MSVLIRGMEMPQETPVLFCIHPDGKVFADLEGGWKEYKSVSFPPHGRLIDADALIDAGWQLSRDNIFIGKYEIALLSSVPTIIPADHEQEEMK